MNKVLILKFVDTLVLGNRSRSRSWGLATISDIVAKPEGSENSQKLKV